MMKMLFILITFLVVDCRAQSLNESGFKAIGTTFIGKSIFDVYETEDQDVVFKKRTPKSKDPEEDATVKNMLSRQTMYEIGLSLSTFDVADKSGPGGLVGNFNMHLPVRVLDRVTVGAEFHNLGHQDGPTPFPGGNPIQNWAAFAEYDYLIIPYGFGGQVLSAGYSIGRLRMEHMTTDNQYVEDGANYEQFLSLRYRWLFDYKSTNNLSNSKNSTSSSFFMSFKISKNHTKELSFGYLLGFGPKASVKQYKEK